MSKFLLPCTQCNSVLSIEMGQAGQHIPCAQCGASVEVPPMREIRQLKRDPSSAAAKQREPARWNEFQGMVFISGLLVAILGFATAGYSAYARSQLETAPPIDKLRDREQRQIEAFTPVQAWNTWKLVRDTTLGSRETPDYLANQAQARWLLILIIAAVVVAVAGICAVVASIVMKPGKMSDKALRPQW